MPSIRVGKVSIDPCSGDQGNAFISTKSGPRYHKNLLSKQNRQHEAWPPQGGLVRYIAWFPFPRGLPWSGQATVPVRL